MAICQVEKCDTETSEAGHKLCKKHWVMDRKGMTLKMKNTEYITATAIGKHFSISNRKVNNYLLELGWIERPPRLNSGWVVSKLGKKKGGANQSSRDGSPYVAWPSNIINDKGFIHTVSEFAVDTDTVEKPVSDYATKVREARKRLKPAEIYASDGHVVRSTPELAIDNWLYERNILHAYEKLIQTDGDEIYFSDWYLKEGSVYIEYWGMEGNKRYESTKEKKLELYKKMDHRLIELHKDEYKQLDDIMPRKLRKWGIETY